jgi:hypothetical protein
MDSRMAERERGKKKEVSFFRVPYIGVRLRFLGRGFIPERDYK